MTRLLSVQLLFAATLSASSQTPWRAVWVEQGSSGPEAARLMVRESGQPPRTLLQGLGNPTRPLLSVDGNTVFYTDLKTESLPDATFSATIHTVPFAGGTPKALAPGIALAVKPTESGSFLYALSGLTFTKKPVPSGDMIVKFSPDAPDEREIIWTEAAVSPDNFQISRDGTRAAGLFPWPQAGLASLADRTFNPIAQGSFPALCPDDSYVLALLSPDRRKIRVFAPGVTPDWELDPAAQLPVKDATLNHLRWSSDALHTAFTASGPAGSGVFVAEMRADLKAITAITQVSESTASVAWTDVWFSGSSGRTSSLPQKPEIKPPAVEQKWPATQDGLTFAWERTGSAANSAALQLEAFALPGRAGALDISSGRGIAPAEAAAQIAAASATSGAFTVQALISERRSGLPCSRRFLSLTDAETRDLCAIYRVDGHLVLRVRTGLPESPLTERLTLTPLGIDDDRPFFLTLTLHARRLTCFIDGVKMKEFTLDQAGLGAWGGSAAFFAGDTAPYGETVPGFISRIAFYSRALAAEEVADAWHGIEGQLPARPTRHKVKLKLVTPAAPVDPAAQRLAMAAGIWSVEQVFTGFVKPKTIALLQWSTINGKRSPFPAMKPGQSIELFVSAIEDQPELHSLTASSAEGAASLPVYFDATVPGLHAAPFPP